MQILVCKFRNGFFFFFTNWCFWLQFLPVYLCIANCIFVYILYIYIYLLISLFIYVIYYFITCTVLYCFQFISPPAEGGKEGGVKVNDCVCVCARARVFVCVCVCV